MPSNSSALWTGTTRTPTGAAFQHPIDVRYVDKADFIKDYAVKHGLGITASDPEYSDGTLDTFLLEASSIVNRKTHRYFNVQTVDETFPRKTLGTGGFREYLTLFLSQTPIRTINRIDFEVLGQFVSVDLTYLQDTNPEEGFIQIVPNLSSAAGTTTPIPYSTQIGTYWVNYTFGYNTIPEDVKKAVILTAIQQIAFQRNVLGLTELRTNQKTFKWGDENVLEKEVDRLLAPFKKMSLASA